MKKYCAQIASRKDLDCNSQDNYSLASIMEPSMNDMAPNRWMVRPTCFDIYLNMSL